MTRVADLFCGGGGETGGIYDAASAAGLHLDLAAVNPEARRWDNPERYRLARLGVFRYWDAREKEQPA